MTIKPCLHDHTTVKNDQDFVSSCHNKVPIKGLRPVKKKHACCMLKLYTLGALLSKKYDYVSIFQLVLHCITTAGNTVALEAF